MENEINEVKSGYKDQIVKNTAKLDQYILNRTLGQGGEGKVKLALNTDDNNIYAIKLMSLKEKDFQKIEKNVQKEIEILQKLNHKHIIKLKEGKINADYTKKSGEKIKVLAMVLEYAPKGELFDYLNLQFFPEEICRFYFKQLLEGLSYIHSQGFAHRDLKTENLLLDDDFNLKISDFGFAQILQGKDGSGKLRTYLGTIGYKAPEIVEDRLPYIGTQVDIFSVGVILFVMLTKSIPFVEASTKCQFFKSLNQSKNTKYWDWAKKQNPQVNFSTEFINLFNRICSIEPLNRHTMAELFMDPWVNGPTATHEEVKKEFTRRQEIIQEEKKKCQKKEYDNILTHGINKFRSQFKDQYQEIQNIYPNILQERKIQYFEGEVAPNALTSPQDIDFILVNLLIKYKLFADKCYLDDNKYKIIFEINADDNQFVQYNKFIIKLLQGENQVLVLIKIIEGNKITVINRISIIRNIILE